MVPGAYFCGKKCYESLVKVGCTGAVQDIFGASSSKHAAGIHRDQMVKRGSLLQIGTGDDQAHVRSRRAETRDQGPELTPRQRIDARCWLVQYQQIGVVDQRAAQAQLLFHAARELGRRAVGKGRETGRLQQLGDPLVALVPALAEKPAEEVHILPHRERGIEIAPQPLRHIGDLRTNSGPVPSTAHIAAQHVKPPRLYLPCPGDQRKETRFADAIRSDQTDNAARRQVDRNCIKCPDLAILKREPLCPHHRPGGRHSSTLPSAASGQGSVESSRTQATPGRPVLM